MRSTREPRHVRGFTLAARAPATISPWPPHTTPPDYPELTPKQVARLIVALERWVANHPEPDEPSLGLYGDALSPRAILEAVCDPDSRDGQGFLRMVRAGLDVATFDEIIAGFERVPVSA